MVLILLVNVQYGANDFCSSHEYVIKPGEGT